METGMESIVVPCMESIVEPGMESIVVPGMESIVEPGTVSIVVGSESEVGVSIDDCSSSFASCSICAAFFLILSANA